mmetsp:Transcript_26805/g.54868  ORF Transcript_26805/g.54868 Transcript_26805/m.54868 type:complete len:260 (-) Transcript_26805:55-834(-)|eukprot:CAMPEP_0183308938 /NCGR_PEP_ID=MMETSP0160_2-20130417/23137_1 /TAXON_ID=2839 ORGANISM="Odontella Sinensis, Strain Grunow 1884" /NCGR_SAMPLE_ID=MMETSP0160_2 /ASSEMBLY_ACC=CAM_ASM_000250 /LENGTH=259 /DNA_ID=CAMNT_0025472863 /DNA_START=64 /DNA_END=843 /DNA_ORIENTATION=+
MFFGRPSLSATLALSAAAATIPSAAKAFVPSTPVGPSFTQFASPRSRSAVVGPLSALLSLELEKPLGMILEEVEEGAAMGVKVEELAEGGSAIESEGASSLVGSKVTSVMGEDVTAMSFDDVMERIIDAPSPVSIEFEVEGAEGEVDGEEGEPEVQYDIGTPVTITVIQDGKETPITARVGDNLRKTLLENKVELYRGLKKKLGNCGGGGQCTYCAVDLVEGEGWGERSEYEDGKIGKYPSARLACMNNIPGPATIRVQ